MLVGDEELSVEFELIRNGEIIRKGEIKKKKDFHIEIYIDRYILLFCCTCARVHFSFAIVQPVKNLVQRQILSSSGSLFQFVNKKENARILSAILLFCILLKIKECGI